MIGGNDLIILCFKLGDASLKKIGGLDESWDLNLSTRESFYTTSNFLIHRPIHEICRLFWRGSLSIRDEFYRLRTSSTFSVESKETTTTSRSLRTTSTSTVTKTPMPIQTVSSLSRPQKTRSEDFCYSSHCYLRHCLKTSFINTIFSGHVHKHMGSI